MSQDALRALCEAVVNDDGGAFTTALEAMAGSPLSGALALAIRQGRMRMVRALIEADADVDTLVRGRTALHVAAMSREGEAGYEHAAATIELLLAAGADPSVRATEEPLGTPLQYAATWGSVDALRLLSADERSLRDEGLAAALGAAAQGDDALAKVELLLERGADPNGHFALLRACERSVHRAVALRLLEAGARADLVDKRKCTPLHCAVAAGSEEVVDALLARSAASDVVAARAVRELDIRKGETARDLAIRRARFVHVAAVEAILRKLGAAVGEVGRFSAQTAPDEVGAWEAAAAYAESVGNLSAANRARARIVAEELAASSAILSLRSAARILERLGVDLHALSKPVFRPGTWTLLRVEDESGASPNLKRWLGKRPLCTLEFGTDGSFQGTLRDRKLGGRWAMTAHKLVIEDQALGELESVLEHDGLSIVEWHRDDKGAFTRYVFGAS